MEKVKIKYVGVNSIFFRTPGWRGKVNPEDKIEVLEEVYEKELKNDWRYELVSTEKSKKKKGDK
jgi:hypothetical protein